MRGYIQGILWGLFIGGLGLGAASFFAGDPKPSPALALAPATDAPTAMQNFSDVPVAPAETALPRLPLQARAPFYDIWVPALTNLARLPELPLVDGDSSPDAAPQENETIVVAEAQPENPPQVDTSEAPVEAPVAAPQIVAPEADGSQPEPAEVAEEPPVSEDSAETGPAVRINRPGAEPAESVGEAAEVIVEEDAVEETPALIRYGAAFENPDDQPVMAVVLTDDGTLSNAPDLIASLGFPVTVVVNALDPTAPDLMRAYRAAGAEVALELALPTGARPTDVEVAFEAALRLMPEAAMLYSSAGDVVQGNRQVTTQVMEVLAANGMGFVVQERGLGGAIRAAAQSGVASAPIERELDSRSETAAAIGRSLDQAAFRARQSGDAVLLGRVDEQTLNALRDWAAANRLSGTSIGPASAVLVASN